VTSCISRAPATINEWLSLVDHCATSVGGEGWVGTAILGAQAAVLLACCAVVVGYVVGRVARPGG
jgi:hypothetical protein